jgi:hypothetical protein
MEQNKIHYPIEVCLIRGPDGLQHVWVGEWAVGREALPNQSIEPRALARFIARTMWDRDASVAKMCAKDRGQIVSLVEFKAPHEVRKFNGIDHPETVNLTPDQQQHFLALVQLYLQEVEEERQL